MKITLDSNPPDARLSFWEIHFNDAGNTVVGNYAIATRLYKLATKQFFPNGWTLIAETSAEATRLLENVQLWHNCLTTIPAWRTVAELSHCRFEQADAAIAKADHFQAKETSQ